MPEEMKDKDKGGEDRVKKAEEELQEKMDKFDPENPHEFPEAEGDTKKDVPPGT